MPASKNIRERDCDGNFNEVKAHWAASFGGDGKSQWARADHLAARADVNGLIQVLRQISESTPSGNDAFAQHKNAMPQVERSASEPAQVIVS